MGTTLIMLLCLFSLQTFAVCLETDNDTQLKQNFSDPNKDMYVIHAMVYQLGIVTNITTNETANDTGNQETFTFYHNNGSQVDLSQILAPLHTNVTAQSLVGVSPVLSSQDNVHNQTTWSVLNNLTNIASPLIPVQGPSLPQVKSIRKKLSTTVSEDITEKPLDDIYKSLYKRETADGNIPVAVQKGSAIIPSAAEIQSLAIPPLLILNNNMSKIPVPIPNTTIAHYAKINTLISKI